MGNSCARSVDVKDRRRKGNRITKRASEHAESPSTDSLASEVDSPTETQYRVIDARWGEPEIVEDSVCDQFQPNPFKHGWCKNCQRQHAVEEGGEIVSSRISKRIGRPISAQKMEYSVPPNPQTVPPVSHKIERKDSSKAKPAKGKVTTSHQSALKQSNRPTSLNSPSSDLEDTIDLAQKLKDRQEMIQALQKAANDRKRILDQVAEREQLRNAVVQLDPHGSDKVLRVDEHNRRKDKVLKCQDECPVGDEWI